MIVALNSMKMKLAELSTKFSNNVLDATKVYSLTVTDKAEMEGVALKCNRASNYK